MKCYSKYHLCHQCEDCGHDTRRMGEYYMVQHAVWDEAISSRWADMLCIGCLEDRIGRRLTAAVFLECPLNVRDQKRSLRLRRAMAA